MIKPKRTNTKKAKVPPGYKSLRIPPEDDRRVLIVTPVMQGPEAGKIVTILARYRRRANGGKGAWMAELGNSPIFSYGGYEDEVGLSLGHWVEIDPILATAIASAMANFRTYCATSGYHTGHAWLVPKFEN